MGKYVQYSGHGVTTKSELWDIIVPFIGIQNIDNLEFFTQQQYLSKTKAKQTLFQM